MKSDAKNPKSNREKSPVSPSAARAKYPVPVYLNFVPGGIEYKDGGNHWKDLSFTSPNELIAKAYAADSTLRLFSLLYARRSIQGEATNPASPPPYYLASLSILAEAVFGTLTGVSPSVTRTWVDSLVLPYLRPSSALENETWLGRFDEAAIMKKWMQWKDVNFLGPSPFEDSAKSRDTVLFASYNDVVSALKALHSQNSSDAGIPNSSVVRRPCGYVFRRGDIAWNCRTCQYDPTCVLCDTCFRESNHDGHEVYFHRTSPGGCCDCGDAEAFRPEGFCPRHGSHSVNNDLELCQNVQTTSIENSNTTNLDVEAAKLSEKSRVAADDLLRRTLPPRFAAALGVVIGAAVQAIVRAVDGSAIGADPVVWSRRWADQLLKISHGRSFDEEYSIDNGIQVSSDNVKSNEKIGWAMTNLPFTPGFSLSLRVHNDDVHTYDEVTTAFYEGNSGVSPSDTEVEYSDGSLVAREEIAKDKTFCVDKDGQSIVRRFTTFLSAWKAFQRLKRRGLHCSVVSSPQLDLEERSKVLLCWLNDVASSHPAAATLVVQALLDVTEGRDILGGVQVWGTARMIPPWSCTGSPDWRRRFTVFPPHLSSSFLTREEYFNLHSIGCGQSSLSTLSVDRSNITSSLNFFKRTDCDRYFYSDLPYVVPSERFRKSPHSLWGTISYPLLSTGNETVTTSHPVLSTAECFVEDMYSLSELMHVIDTDLRKENEAESLISCTLSHELQGLHIVSGIGLGSVGIDDIVMSKVSESPSAEELKQLLSVASFRAPVSPLMLLLLLDPYPTKQSRASIHSLFLSLLTDYRFKARFSAAFGGVAYRSLSTLFASGVGTDADTVLGFSVQVFTAGSLVRALGSIDSMRSLLGYDGEGQLYQLLSPRSQYIVSLPISYTIVRCVHSNLLGGNREARTSAKAAERWNDPRNEYVNASGSQDFQSLLVYRDLEHPLTTLLPAASDDGFLDVRSTQYKRLPNLLRDLKYVLETPGTAIRLLSTSSQLNLTDLISISTGRVGVKSKNVLSFSQIWSRLVRVLQGIDFEKRKISGGHVEYEKNRWQGAFNLNLNLLGARDALAECPFISQAPLLVQTSEEIHSCIGNLMTELLREIKRWLYREDLLELNLSGSSAIANEASQLEVLQRSTLHVAVAKNTRSTANSTDDHHFPALAFSCATQLKLSEAHLILIEEALKVEQLNKVSHSAVMGDWLRVPHSLLEGDALSFHIPLHRSLAKCILSICSKVVSKEERDQNPMFWWKLPVLDCTETNVNGKEHPLCDILRCTLKSSNCQVTWSSGPECMSHEEADVRRRRCRAISASVASAKVIHSICDHPLRCIVGAEQIDRHLWVRNGQSIANIALNYSIIPICRAFRDLDFALVQFSCAGFCVGLGVRRVFALLLNRFSMDGYLCDPERRPGSKSPTTGSQMSGSFWVYPPRLQDPDHASVLSESFFATLSAIVTELPLPPPQSNQDHTYLKCKIRRELIHVLAAESRSYSEAMSAVASGVGNDDEREKGIGASGNFRAIFSEILRDVARQKNVGNRSAATPSFELKAECSEEYDPTFIHLRRPEHQHALDNIARLRRQHYGNHDSKCAPLVLPPVVAHPRFVACRLLLHIPALDAALRRALLFVLTGGQWLPPEQSDPDTDEIPFDIHVIPMDTNSSEDTSSRSGNERRLRRGRYGPNRQSSSISGNISQPFSSNVVAASAVSFIEVLEVITLQIHTLEQCRELHYKQPYLDQENKSVSAGLCVESYLERLICVPDNLVDVWALRPYPFGPLSSKGSGSNRGSILGLLVALHEHLVNSPLSRDSLQVQSSSDEGHSGSRYLSAEGLKWVLRVVWCLAAYSCSIEEASAMARSGIRNEKVMCSENRNNNNVSHHQTIMSMLHGVDNIWPQDKTEQSTGKDSGIKTREARLAAQRRILESMKKKQESFVASMPEADSGVVENKYAQNDTDLCIICRCDDKDGENNGPLGYLGHVQRSRISQLRSFHDQHHFGNSDLFDSYLVVSDKGCQLREGEAMDSKPVACLVKGSIVRVNNRKASPIYDLLARRVFVSYIDESGKQVEGWASTRSTLGYLILRPLLNLCYTNSRWGSTRPIVKQCGHAAHARCVETHLLSLHQKAATDHPYDGRYATNIKDGEFLCPLCKQLSNMIIPKECFSDEFDELSPGPNSIYDTEPMNTDIPQLDKVTIELTNVRKTLIHNDLKKAFSQFGAAIMQGMQVTSWDRNNLHKKMQLKNWIPEIRRWDFIEERDAETSENPSIGNILTKLRQQLLAWAAIGHSAAASEASTRNVLQSDREWKTYDPWKNYDDKCRDTHQLLIEMRRIIVAASQLQVVLSQDVDARFDIKGQVQAPSIGSFLSDILEGNSNSYHCLGSANHTKDAQLHGKDWKCLISVLRAMPCHVARDETLHYRNEARSVATAMWLLQNVSRVPVPFCIRLVKSCGVVYDEDVECLSESIEPVKELVPPFLPAVATAFLYLPLLSWDLTTFAGAIFSNLATMERYNSSVLFEAARVLLVARMVQVVVTSGKIQEFISQNDIEYTPESNISDQSFAVTDFWNLCMTYIETEFVPIQLTATEAQSLSAILSRSILPYARTIVLILRASLSALRGRRRLYGTPPVQGILESGKLMNIEDGFALMLALEAPLPSNIVSQSAWHQLIKRWLVAARALDSYHECRRNILKASNVTNIPSDSPKNTSTEVVKDNLSIGSSEGVSSSEHNDSIGEYFIYSDGIEEDDEDEFVDESIENDEDTGVGLNVLLRGLDSMHDVNVDNGEEMIGDDDMEDVVVDADFDISDQISDYVGNEGGEQDESNEFRSSEGSDENVSRHSWDNDDSPIENDDEFANVSRSSIIPFQPSFLGSGDIGPGPRGCFFDYRVATPLMRDLSHLGAIHSAESRNSYLIKLPRSFVELYGLVNKIKSSLWNGFPHDDGDDNYSVSETAICLITGEVMHAGSSDRYLNRSKLRPGNCTLHARKIGSGTGVFFFVQKCTVLLMHNNKSAYSPSLYVDENGEEDNGLRRGRPLYLSEERYLALETLWRNHGIPREVALIRSTSDRVIRDDWY